MVLEGGVVELLLVVLVLVEVLVALEVEVLTSLLVGSTSGVGSRRPPIINMTTALIPMVSHFLGSGGWPAASLR